MGHLPRARGSATLLVMGAYGVITESVAMVSDRQSWHKRQAMLAKRYDPMKLAFDWPGKVYRKECEGCGEHIYSEWPHLKRCWDCQRKHNRDTVRQWRKVRGLVASHKKKRCESCGRWFQPQRSTARFCCGTCRVDASRRAKQEKE